MNIRFLETVLWLARMRSIKATADKLCITQTAVSNRIAAIEQDLSVRLFERTEQGFAPTGDGLRFIARAEPIVDACHALRREMLDPGRLRGHVRLGAVSTLVTTVFPTLVRTVREEFPHVSLSVTTDLPDRLHRELDAGKLDMLLVSCPPVLGAGYEITPLCSFSMQFVASPSLGIDPATPLTPQELARYPVVGYPPGSPSQARIDGYFSDHAQQAVVIHASITLPVNVQMVTAGVGIAPVPLAAVRKELEQGQLMVVPVAKPFVPVQYVAAYPARGEAALPRAVAALARQAASLYCESADPAWAWMDHEEDSPQERL